MKSGDFPGGPVVKNPPANARDTGVSPDLEDPTCCGTSKSMHHDERARAVEPVSRERSLCTAAGEWPPLTTTTGSPLKETKT